HGHEEAAVRRHQLLQGQGDLVRHRLHVPGRVDEERADDRYLQVVAGSQYTAPSRRAGPRARPLSLNAGIVSLSDPRLRRAALLSSGAWAVHTLRFALAPVDGGAGPGHAYLHTALPLLTVLVALAATGFVTRLVAPRDEGSAPRSLRAE